MPCSLAGRQKLYVPVIRTFTLVYALLSAALYCALMPPWEGFDELYHYGYVQHVSGNLTLPVIGKTALSRELWSSLDYFPVSHYVQPYLQRSSISFDRYFRLTAEQRFALRRGADAMNRDWKNEASPRANYEAQQPPLTYFLLAPVDALACAASVITRLLVDRMFLSVIAIVLLWKGTRLLARRLGMPPCFEAACLFVVFSCQMLYAETCRIGNDALAAPWLLFLIVALIDALERPTLKRTAWVGFVIAVGLLIKASMLPLLPLAFLAPIVLVMRRKLPLGTGAKHALVSAAIIGALAAPWYVRNMLLYHNLTANVEATSDVGAKKLLKAAANLPWGKSIAYTAHSALWTGNNSFTTFSEATLNVVLALLALAILLYCFRLRSTWPELITIIAIILYGAGLIVAALSFFSSSAGKIIAPMPWYLQVLLAPVLALAFLGASRTPIRGRWVGILTVLLWAYVAAASWVVKLLPLYGGLDLPHARPGQIFKWYLENAGQRDSVLSNLCPAPASILYVLLVAVLATLLFVTVALSVKLYQHGETSTANQVR